MSVRYTLRLEDGSDAGEVELGQPAAVGDNVAAAGGVEARVLAVVPVEIVQEFIGDNPIFGILEVEWIESVA